MDASDLFTHLKRFDAGMLTAGQLWNYLSENSLSAEDTLDDNALEVFDTAELVLAEYTSDLITEDLARKRLRELLVEDGYLQLVYGWPVTSGRLRFIRAEAGMEPERSGSVVYFVRSGDPKRTLNLEQEDFGFDLISYRPHRLFRQVQQSAQLDVPVPTLGSDTRVQEDIAPVWERGPFLAGSR